jgi:hypothetical protein
LFDEKDYARRVVVGRGEEWKEEVLFSNLIL